MKLVAKILGCSWVECDFACIEAAPHDSSRQNWRKLGGFAVQMFGLAVGGRLDTCKITFNPERPQYQGQLRFSAEEEARKSVYTRASGD